MLQVWLPLNGNLDNQGLSNVTVLNSGTTVDNNGKIGQCYRFNGSDNFINLGNIGSCFDGSAFSICFWIYSLENKTRAVVFSSYGLPSTSNFFGLELNSSNTNYCNNNLRFDWLGSDTYSPDDFINYNTWTHVCVTYDGVNQIKMYKNGELIQTNTRVLNSIPIGNIYYLGRDSRTGATAFNGKLNDFRIYNHCLSPRECKLLSSAIVLHYPLDRGGFGNDNLLLNTNQGKTYWSWSGNGGTRTLEDYEEIGVKMTATVAANSGSWSVIQYNDPQLKNILEPDTTYTCSLDVKPPVNATFSFQVMNGNGTQRLTVRRIDCPIVANKWNHVVWTFTTKNELVIENQIVYITGISSQVAGYEIYLKNIKIEKGSVATPWTPNSADTLYTSMGLNDNVVYDVSGFGHNATSSGVIYSADTPRYSMSTSFDGVDDYIQLPFNDVVINGDIFTINLWFKKESIGSKSYETLLGGPSGFEMDTRAGGTSTLSLYMASTRGGSMYSPFSLNQWYMITLVNDGTNELYYVNGQLVKTIKKKSMPTGNYFLGAWQTKDKQNYKGLMSDFRIYKTALSADDILALYQVPISLSNNGTLFAGEFVGG